MSSNSKEGGRIKNMEGYEGTDGGWGRGGNSKQGGTGQDIDGGTELTGQRRGFVGQDRAGQGVTGGSSKDNDTCSWQEVREGRQCRAWWWMGAHCAWEWGWTPVSLFCLSSLILSYILSRLLSMSNLLISISQQKKKKKGGNLGQGILEGKRKRGNWVKLDGMTWWQHDS